MNPTIEDLTKFLEAYRALDEFEMNCRLARGYGAYPKDAKLPMPEAQRAIAWLEGMIAAGAVNSNPVLNLDNMALRGRVAFLQSELYAAAGQFLLYAQNHANKNPPDRDKARVNADWAERLMRSGSSGDKFVNNGGN